ncbi:MAG: hypothetical protein IJZ28_00645, partial [Clostridia bacterium]|nr:hypothetical protein [Clostridia bacterium]
MQCAVTKFVQQNTNGLMLVDMPTGGGKTYQTKEIISKYIRGEILGEIPRIIYITPLRKNVDDLYSDLQKEFKDNLELLDSYVLRLYPNYECVINNLVEVEELIPYEIRNKDSYKNLKKQINLYNNFSECNQFDLADATLKEIQRIYEPAFRKDVTRVLIKKYPIPRDRRRAINKDCSWLPKVYPSCLTEDRKVLIMTMSKFLVANDPIIGKPYRFISHSKTRRALIFVDEFDSTKEVVLQQEIDRCVDHKLDLIKLFSGISNTLKGRVLPESIFAGSTDETAEKGSAVVFANMKKNFLDSEKEFNLNYLFKLDEGINLQQRCFLFDDHKLHTIHASDKEGHIVLEINKAKNINLIKIEPHDSDGLFYRSIYRMKSAINKFISCCAIMARNYRNYYNERNQDKMEIDHAVSTILDPFNLDGRSNQTLQELIINDMSIPSDKRGVDIIQTDFYLDGFRYYDFEDDISHDLSTTTSICYFENTPEKFMLSLSSIARVVGLSATGTIQTVTGNYNLEYLQVMLADRYHVLSDDDKNRIAEKISDRIGGEYPIKVTRQQVTEESSLDKIIEQLVSSKVSFERLKGVLQEFEKSDDNESNRLYHIKR